MRAGVSPALRPLTGARARGSHRARVKLLSATSFLLCWNPNVHGAHHCTARMPDFSTLAARLFALPLSIDPVERWRDVGKLIEPRIRRERFRRHAQIAIAHENDRSAGRAGRGMIVLVVADHYRFVRRYAKLSERGEKMPRIGFSKWHDVAADNHFEIFGDVESVEHREGRCLLFVRADGKARS